MTPPQQANVDLDDIQGLVRFGYKHHTEACYLMLRVKERNAAKAWLASAPVTNAVPAEPPPPTALQVAFTSQGLRALGVPADVIEQFSDDFLTGMDEPNRSRRLGDVGTNHPGQWRWGSGANVPHVLLMLFALPGRLASWKQTVLGECDHGFELITCLGTSDLDGVEPFGFVDGISQPQVDWGRKLPVRDAEEHAYRNDTCLGEFLLGYPNEYGGYTDRPLLDPQRDGLAPTLPRAEDEPHKADLGRNGSYLVFRQLRQDVHAFWQFVDKHAGSDPTRREQLAAAMVGRKMNGEPLVAKDGSGPNSFTYHADPRGLRCPMGAHIRRVNPRNADLPPGDEGPISWIKRTLGFDAKAREQDLVASTRFHRLLRRGREYGPGVSPQQALSNLPPGDDTGLHFICLNANLARQFEFVQGAWIDALHFEGLPSESDPLMGTRQVLADGSPTDGFSMPQPHGPNRRITGLPQFVTVKGGAYFFLPGIRALRYLTK